jgi:gamma-glutamyltranspeptidase / glutathione hydrolase
MYMEKRRTGVTVLVVTFLFLLIPGLVMAWGTRPVLMGTKGGVACGHYLAAEAGMKILREGGNAIDAGVTQALAESLLEMQSYSPGGEMPILIYSARDRKVYSIDGNMAAPKKATIEWFEKEGIMAIPDSGFLCAGVPAVIDAMILALDRFGTKSFADVAEAVIQLAEDGYPMYAGQRGSIEENAEWYKANWPTSYATLLPKGRLPEVGEVYKNPAFARTFKRLVQAEKAALATGASRSQALKAVRDYFYKGPIAREIVEFQKTPVKDKITGKAYPGFLEVSDFENYSARLAEPASTTFMGYEVYKCGVWTQGPVFLQHLNLLEQFDIKKMKPDSAEWIHLWIETAKLAHQDKISYYGDPEFVYVPIKGLLSKEYAKERAKLIDMNKASMELLPGDPWKYDDPSKKPQAFLPTQLAMIEDHGTTGTRAIDSMGNLFSATPSGGWFPTSPIIPEVGFPLGTRGQMFYLDPKHPKALVGGKRPSTSLTPSLVMKDGKPFGVFGTPGGDQQDQHTHLTFLNAVAFGMNLQEAIDYPKWDSKHFATLFYPVSNTAPGRGLGRFNLEMGRITEETAKKLEAMGHKVTRVKDWGIGDNTTFMTFNAETGVISAASSPRNERNYAIVW